ncbi:DnaJ homolog subfamily C member 11 homolog [Talaromyces islandicus]|uniref:DnaJ homolog subfamily C member 11 homolog n=1 Tax=Talaromyces islandicus TaxID=28573 RepID=A0A0U1LXM9_TALIS|nr:DnaJ homolog subfamily C member 11 homolog [Talaromyces islandicus]
MASQPNRNAQGAAAHDRNLGIEEGGGGGGEDDFDFEMELDDYPDEIDYYSVLGLSRNPPPTDSQLRSAYHNLTLSFHPDKQPAHLVETAKAQFSRVQEAYEVLSDPKKRIVYDLEGAAAVRREWGSRGLMSRRVADDDNDKQLGPKAMAPEEFKQWFLKKMQTKERKMIHELVSGKGTITIGLDASSMLSPGEEEGGVYISVPEVRPNRAGVSYSFTTPLPDISSLWSSSSDGLEVSDEESDQGKQKRAESDNSPEVTFNAEISGTLRATQRKVAYLEDGIEKTTKIPDTPVIVPATLNLGASFRHTLSNIGLRTGAQPNPWSWLENATVGGQVRVFPHQMLSIYVLKGVSPFPFARQISVAASATVAHPRQTLPILGLSANRRFGTNSFGTMSFSTGTIFWPEPIKGLLGSFFSLFVNPPEISIVSQDPSTLSIKYACLPEVISASEAKQFGLPLPPPKRESWHCELDASPVGVGLSLSYGRTIFGEKLEDPPLSEWNLDGYHPTVVPKSFRGVRIEADAALSLHGIAWNITAHRKISSFSSIGLGVGLRDQHGLTMSLSWRRLGQSIKVPIVICPIDLADAQLSFWAVMVPWLTYVGLEFTVIRPRERRRRLEALKRRHRRLKAKVPAHRAESAQQIEMMTELVQRRQHRERVDGGLFIERAEYGHMPLEKTKTKPKKKKNTGIDSDLAEQSVVDVTIPVAALVEKHQLVISKETTRFQITGFYDPAPLLPKTLKVWYTFGNQRHYAEVNDGQDLFCPRREDLVDV